MEIRLRKTVGQRLVNGADDLLSAIPFDQSIQGHITRRVLTVGQVRLRRRRKRDGGEHPQRRFASAERGRSERRNGKGGLTAGIFAVLTPVIGGAIFILRCLAAVVFRKSATLYGCVELENETRLP